LLKAADGAVDHRAVESEEEATERGGSREERHVAGVEAHQYVTVTACPLFAYGTTMVTIFFAPS
jgi:hypothetical protein